MREIFLTADLFISGNFEQLWFLWQKSPPPRMRENFLTSDLSISGNFQQLWFLWQKSPPPPQDKGNFFDQIYPFQAISSNFGFCGRKVPPPKDEGQFFDFRFIHFRQFWATLVFVAEKPPPQNEGKFFNFRFIHFRQFQANLVFVAEKLPPLPRMSENFLTSDLSSFLPFRHGPGSCHTGRIPKVPILQIHTQIPPIQISSTGYQLCQLFKIPTYTELQDSGSWCIWKVYRQPYHNTH